MLGLLGDKKKLAGTIIESMLSGESKKEETKVNIDMGIMTAAEELLEAIRSGDVSTLAKSLEGFIDMKSSQFKSQKEIPEIDLEGEINGDNDTRTA